MGKKAANLVLKQCQDGRIEGRICQNGRKGRCQSATIEKNASSLAEKMMPNRQKGKENDARKAENIVSDQH